ncbi:MAG: transcriptional regulator [Gammaproteobacteria bacterium HGW-Gammaproteobacteria-8]|nr:MAG: transcriptional regulator [Gammaproteobacteria bacterium HGW-Gammaproteobacteria-8]
MSREASSEMKTYTLAVAAERSGLSPHQVRIYLDMGLVSPCATTDGGFRLFDADCIRRLKLIKVCRDAEIGLADIGNFIRSLDGDDHNRCREAEQLLAQRLLEKRRALERCSRALSAEVEATSSY